MKRVVLLHGTDGSPDELWFPWLSEQFELEGYKVYAPLLPDNQTPNKQKYESFLKESGWDFSNNIIVGHSSGATTVLNLLTEEWFPSVKAIILVGTFLNEHLLKQVNPDWYDEKQFIDLFKDSYDIGMLKEKCQKYYFVHGDDDPYCSIDDATELCKKLGGKMIIVNNGGHLASSSGILELPQIIEQLEADDIL